MKIKYKNIIIILLALIFLFSMAKIVMFLLDLNKGKNAMQDLIQDVIRIEVDDDTQEEIFKIDFDKLLDINKDIIGWIRFNQDKVNYPIVHTNDNSYYLNRTFEKKYNQVGSIFMDYRNVSFDDKNVVLFGHSMLDGSMFGSLNDVFKSGFFDKEENQYIQLYNKDNELLIYQIFSYYIIEAEEYYITTSFTSESEFETFIKTITKRSYKKFDVEVSSDDKILTLSTCSGVGGTSSRKVIHAKRVS